ncbi:unnamed protein product [Caenorhabditis angaria]|uniref:C-type lectin domain-containing protein n=1 Tax=Caenorhabditis angaria TaxID=860376 RepID=A0A9P1ID58_9PELO|nr:unnamed protein product [Caenorhabditis angaria]
MFPLILRFFLIQNTVSSTMLVFYGSPGANINCTSDSTTSWDSCVTNCAENLTCFLAYSSPSITCNYCDFGGFPDITYSSSETDYILALKTDNTTECNSDFELLKVNDFDKLKICPFTWTKFIRENYVVCMQRLYTTFLLNKPLATDRCSTNGWSLLGFENQDELSYWSVPRFPSLSNQSLYIGLEEVNSVFSWTDPWLTGPGVINWAPGHPKIGYDCASMRFTTGLIQSENCTANICLNEPHCTYSVFCGFLMK